MWCGIHVLHIVVGEKVALPSFADAAAIGAGVAHGLSSESLVF